MKLLRVLISFSFLAIVVPSSGLNSRKLEDGSLIPGVEKKCHHCGHVPPPPPPQSPPPRSKYPPPPSGDGGGSSNYPNNAPPPPSQQYVYMLAPPGNELYTVNPTYTKNGACPGLGAFGFLAIIGSLLLNFIDLV